MRGALGGTTRKGIPLLLLCLEREESIFCCLHGEALPSDRSCAVTQAAAKRVVSQKSDDLHDKVSNHPRFHENPRFIVRDQIRNRANRRLMHGSPAAIASSKATGMPSLWGGRMKTSYSLSRYLTASGPTQPGNSSRVVRPSS